MRGSEIERRPGHDGSLSTTFPKEWGEAPTEPEKRARWIKDNVAAGYERRMRGEDVPWLEDRK